MLFWKRLNWRIVRNFGYFYCASYALGRHVGELVICSGPSMHPTIQDGDLIFAERLSVSLSNLRRGDIVGALAPHNPSEMLCKRLTAKEYDIVTNCYLLPNGKIPRGTYTWKVITQWLLPILGFLVLYQQDMAIVKGWMDINALVLGKPNE
ncbi:Signal peptidase I [Dirofilaria immitis]|nr:Signal peptidase I [Dirofilaria immitis]